MIKHTFKIIGQEMVLISHRYDHNYQINFSNLKDRALQVAGKVVFDMLAYYDSNMQLADI